LRRPLEGQSIAEVIDDGSWKRIAILHDCIRNPRPCRLLQIAVETKSENEESDDDRRSPRCQQIARQLFH
jgi:hypothetical protein